MRAPCNTSTRQTCKLNFVCCFNSSSLFVCFLFFFVLINVQVRLQALVDPEVPPMLIGDFSRLRQILVNLIGNAYVCILFQMLICFNLFYITRIKFTDQGEVFLRCCVVKPDQFKDMTTQWEKEYENTLEPNKSIASPIAHSGEGIKILFSVQDSGSGMNAQQLNKLFNAFYQADSTTTKRHEGTGLGLVISKSLVCFCFCWFFFVALFLKSCL